MGEQGHASLMDGVYKYQRHFYDLTRKYYLLGRDRLLDELQVPDGGSILEVGCGTGRNLIKAAKRYPKARLFGVDISDEMLKTARANIDKANLSNRIVLAQGDATGFSSGELFGLESFDRVFISYALSMIPDWKNTIRHSATLLGETGSLHLVDFGQQERMPGWFRAMLFAWLSKFHVSPRGDLEDYLQDVAKEGSAEAAFRKLFRGYAVLGSLTRATA